MNITDMFQLFWSYKREWDDGERDESTIDDSGYHSKTWFPSIYKNTATSLIHETTQYHQYTTKRGKGKQCRYVYRQVNSPMLLPEVIGQCAEIYERGKIHTACRLVIHICSGNGSASRFCNLHLIVHDASANDDNHYFVGRNVESLLHVKKLTTHKTTRQRNAA